MLLRDPAKAIAAPDLRPALRIVRVLYQLGQDPVTVLGADHFVQIPETLVNLDFVQVRDDGVVQHGSNLPVQLVGGERPTLLVFSHFAGGSCGHRQAAFASWPGNVIVVSARARWRRCGGPPLSTSFPGSAGVAVTAIPSGAMEPIMLPRRT